MSTVLRVIFALTMFSGSAIAADKPLTLAQLHESVQWATTHFAEDEDSSNETIYGFSVAHGKEGGANVRVYFENGRSYTSYFCHLHKHKNEDGHEEESLDCH